ncbi:AfsR/SARP family transcriptional regulator [Armatimonas rosea]|uniref:Putative ATPase n=1 Tax=Armatimonas rosea TaxID=685828 RepID=A0A7W9SM66_ARMRO|nr:hypothetical protein [Armatimonas rosea]MBB6048473.1 putative ATPase [Armatimonas rosea]
MENWHFELFGGVRARRGSLVLDELAGRKTGALLALLALAPGRLRPREEVIDLIWPEIDFDDARNRFKQTLAVLRKQLEPAGTAPGSVLIADRLQVGLASSVQVDVVAFQEALRRAASAKDSLAQAGHLDSALALYQGELAPGFYLDALLSERERLAALAESARERRQALEPALLLSVFTESRKEEGQAQTEWAPVLQRPLNAFFGRQWEKDEIVRLLREHRLVTILGPGGTGKTRLVQELEGIRFLSLSSLREGSRLHEALVAALELPPSDEATLVRLRAALEGQTLALDNFEQLVATGGPEAVDALQRAIPTLRLIVTSRIKLNLAAEQVFPLSPLVAEDAVALFCDRAQRARPDFTLTDKNKSIVTDLCRRLDGLPLALELAAARMAILTPAQILERLSRRFDLLADKRRDREARHTSLRAALDWGWSLLAPDVQYFFTQLCIFRGSFSVEAAETITGELLAIDYLQALVDSSFLRADGERFRLLETLREYGLERLSPLESARLTQAHAEFFLACLKDWQPLLTGGQITQGIQSFKQAQDNVSAALERTLSLSPALATALCLAANPFWKVTYSRQLALAYLTQTLAQATAAGVAEGELAALHGCLGPAYLDLGDYSTARFHQQQSYEYNRRLLEERTTAGASEAALLPLRETIAEELNNLGNLLYFETRFDEAVAHYEEARLCNQALGNDVRLARNYSGLFCVFASRGHLTTNAQERRTYFEQAQHFAEEGTAVCRRAQQDFTLCFMLRGQAFLLPLLGEPERALPLLHEGFALSCALENWPIVADCLTCYCHQAIRGEHWEEAAQLQGAETALREQWNTHAGWEAPPDDEGVHTRPFANLPERLGQERYEALYQAGFHASLDSLKALVATLPHASPFEK